MILSSASSTSQAFSTVRQVFSGPKIGANHIQQPALPLARKFRGEAKPYGRGNGRGVPLCLERRSERLWCDRLYQVAPESFRGRIFVRKGRRKVGKCDNLSFLGMFLSQMGEAPGGTKGYALLLEGGGPDS